MWLRSSLCVLTSQGSWWAFTWRAPGPPGWPGSRGDNWLRAGPGPALGTWRLGSMLFFAVPARAAWWVPGSILHQARTLLAAWCSLHRMPGQESLLIATARYCSTRVAWLQCWVQATGHVCFVLLWQAPLAGSDRAGESSDASSSCRCHWVFTASAAHYVCCGSSRSIPSCSESADSVRQRFALIPSAARLELGASVKQPPFGPLKPW
jgi:hypothetical protein